jgi:hypothetical protein
MARSYRMRSKSLDTSGVRLAIQAGLRSLAEVAMPQMRQVLDSLPV